jgi:hypothetical protein
LDQIENIEEIFGIKNKSFGIQVKLNSFLICKYTVKWNLQAEISLLNRIFVFNKSRSKKMMRRIKIIYELLKSLIMKKDFDENKLYKLIDKKNLE